MDGVLGIVLEISKYVFPKIVDYVGKAVAGEDVSDHEVRALIPSQYQTEINDRIKTEQRKAAGLPT